MFVCICPAEHGTGMEFTATATTTMATDNVGEHGNRAEIFVHRLAEGTGRPRTGQMWPNDSWKVTKWQTVSALPAVCHYVFVWKWKCLLAHKTIVKSGMTGSLLVSAMSKLERYKGLDIDLFLDVFSYRLVLASNNAREGRDSISNSSR
jgi:hypothetical protein